MIQNNARVTGLWRDQIAQNPVIQSLTLDTSDHNHALQSIPAVSASDAQNLALEATISGLPFQGIPMHVPDEQHEIAYDHMTSIGIPASLAIYTDEYTSSWNL